MVESMGEMLGRQADRYGDRTFLYFEDDETSFRDLHDKASRLAGGLRRLGLAKGDKVCLLLPNMPEFVHAFFGIVMLGAVEVPINARLTPPEVAYIVANSDAKLLITIGAFRPYVEHVRGEAPELRHIVMIGETKGEEISFEELSQGEPVADTDVSGDDEAGIIYTSGTTGHPKGVVLTHHNYLANAWQLREAAQMGESDRFCCILPLFHVNAQLVTMLAPLRAGAAMILLEKFSPKTFLGELARYRATAFSAVPTVYAILNILPDADQYDLNSLRFCICGAAPMPVEVFETFERKFTAFILEGYGLSEGTCASSVNPLDGTRKIGSIGLPLKGQQMKIVDDAGQERPRGQIGEIVVQGEVVMKEYYKNPSATAETLRGGWLHTGDLGYQDEEGYFFIVGRKKEMIIRGGENIYPKEVEEVIYQYEGVAEAAVVGVPHEIWGEEVVAFIAPRAGIQISKEELMAYLAERVADYKRPREVYFREGLPKTATGKIQKVKIVEQFKQQKG